MAWMKCHSVDESTDPEGEAISSVQNQHLSCERSEERQRMACACRGYDEMPTQGRAVFSSVCSAVALKQTLVGAPFAATWLGR